MMIGGFLLILSFWVFHMTKSEQIAHRVSTCPRSKAEWQKASKKMNCSEDYINPKNRYHCLPDDRLTTLLEFCYSRRRAQVVKEDELEHFSFRSVYGFFESKNVVTHYDCSRFIEGCPNAVYYTDEMYTFPACTEIDPIQHCYKAEPSCQQKPPLTAVVNDTATLTTSFTPPTIETTKEENNPRVVVLYVTFGFLVLIISIVVWRMRKRRRHFGPKENEADDEIRGLLKPEQLELENETDGEIRGLLKPEQLAKLEEIEADIKRLEIDYLLQELPSDQILFSLIAKLLKIPQEILYWSHQDRGKFVRSMKACTISVYIGRGMVIGCAGAGKTTLVKKLKGVKDLDTESTSGIEIHTHVFKLNENESTITDCDEQEKKKGCVCLTPITLNKSTENVDNDEERFLTDVSEAEEGVPNNGTPLLSQSPFHKESHDGMNNESHDGMNNESHDGMNKESRDGMKNESHNGMNDESYDGMNDESHDRNSPSNSRISEERAVVADEERVSPSNLATDDLPFKMNSSQEVEESNIESEQTINFSDCTASVNEKKLKMFSLLDFAGHSAYYACHHIFFSPRAFFILVVDMTKKYKSVPDKPRPNENLIYSNWTYEDYIRYWLGSIHTYSSKTAPVILVFSHAEGYNGDPKKTRDSFLEVLYCLPKVLHDHVDKDRVFLIEKEKNTNMEDLRRCIASLVKSQSHWGENIPIAWAKLESILKRLQGSKIYSFYRLLKDVQKTNDLSINNEEELINALTFFHETGVILFRSEIKNSIILDVQWFVDALKCIILEEDHFDKKDKSNLEKFQELNEFGLLSSDLLNILWEEGNFNRYQDDLINHIKQLDILARLSEDKWYVPCMNKQKYSVETLNNCDVSSTLCFLFEFLPIVVFHRLVVACINKLEMEPWKRKHKMCIFHKVAILNCKNQTHRVLIGICENKDADYPYSIEIQTNVIKNGQKLNNQLSSNLKREICKILTDLTQAFPSCDRSFKVGYRCHVKPFSGNPEDHIIREENMLRKSEVECSDCTDNHCVNVGSIMCSWEENTDPHHSDFKIKNEGRLDERAVRASFVFMKENLYLRSLRDILMANNLFLDRDNNYVFKGPSKHFIVERLIKLMIRKKKV